MTFGFLTEDVQIPVRRFLAVAFLFSSTLAWFYVFHAYLLDEIFADLGSVQWLYLGKALFYISIVLSAIIGSLISERVKRRALLWSWIAFGVLTTASLAVFHGVIFSLLSSALLGASFGVGFPSCEAFLADSTAVEERARVSGTIVFVTFSVVFLTILASSLLNLGVIELVLLSVVLRATSFFALPIDPCARETGKKRSWLSILTQKDFAFYLFPWLMFNIANGLISFGKLPESWSSGSIIMIGSVLQYAGCSIFALVSGVMADRFGRKPPIIIGLVLLGVSYAFLGVATSPLSWLVAMTTQGIAWGSIMVSYALTVIGDMASPGSKERFYALGGIIPLIMYTSFSGVSELLNINVPLSALSSALSIILFFCIVPIWLAAETLPESKVRARRLRDFIKKVGKVVEESRKTRSS